MTLLSIHRAGARADFRADLRPNSSLSASQLQFDALSSSLGHQICDLTSLVAMTAGSLTYRLCHLGLSSLSIFRAFPMLARFLAPAVSLIAEVGAFRSAHALLAPIPESPSNWSTDFVNFASLKFFGRISRRANPFWGHVTQASGMVAGNQIAYALGLTLKPQGSLVEQWTQAEITCLQMNLGTRLLGLGLGHRQSLLESQILRKVSMRNVEVGGHERNVRSLLSFHSYDEGEGHSRHLSEIVFRNRKPPVQARFSPGYFLDNRRVPFEAHPLQLSFTYHELEQRVGDREALRAYIKAYLHPESYFLRQLANNVKPMNVAYEVHGLISVLRFLGLQGDSSESLRKGFFDVLALEEDPRVLARHEAWSARSPVMSEIVSWLHDEGITHSDPWTRHYAIRLLQEWSLAHPEISSPEHAQLRRQMVSFACRAIGDIAWTNMILGWHLLHQLEPVEAMSDSYLAEIPMAHVLHPRNLEFGLERYVDAGRTEGAFLKHQRSLSGVPIVIGSQAVEGTFSLHDIHPSHSLADFNPNSRCRFEAVKQKYGILLKMREQNTLTRENIMRDFLLHHDPEEGPIILHWQGKHPWLKGGHHRMTALYLAAENGLIPRSWLLDLPLLTFDWSPYLPERIYYQYFSRGSRPLSWRDLLPEGYLRL